MLFNISVIEILHSRNIYILFHLCKYSVFETNTSERKDDEDMNTTNRVKLLRFSYWIAAILDAIYAFNAGLVWLIDDYSGFDPIRLLRFTEGLESRYAWGLTCVLITTWTILLIWAEQKPVERSMVGLLTALPLVTGLLIDTFFAISVGLVTWIDILAVQLAYAFLIIILSLSYFLTKSLKQEAS
jgi:hypothetical protein